MHYYLMDTSARTRARILVFVVPVLFTAAALYLLFESLMFQANGVRTVAEVVKVYDHQDGTYSAQVAYTSSAGARQEAGLWVSSPDYNFPLGTELEIMYEESEPYEARLIDFESIWGLPAIIGGIALVCWPPALLLWGWLRRRWRAEAEA